jgi:hypothetical protein
MADVMKPKRSITRIAAIKEFFDTKERPVENAEIRALGKEGLQELGDAAIKALDAELAQ